MDHSLCQGLMQNFLLFQKVFCDLLVIGKHRLLSKAFSGYQKKSSCSPIPFPEGPDLEHDIVFRLIEPVSTCSGFYGGRGGTGTALMLFSEFLGLCSKARLWHTRL